MNNKIITWLLEDDNPAVRYRTQIEILEQSGDKSPVIKWLINFLPIDWKDAKFIKAAYYLTAFAECGLKIDDIPIIKNNIFMLENVSCISRHGCGDFMSLRALVCLGLGNEPAVVESIENLQKQQLPDGGFLCGNRLKKFKHIPKSCYKANLYALMLCAECKKRGIKTNIDESVLTYFWKHNIFYRTSDLTALVLNERTGWRTIDTFHPFEAMRVGLHNIIESLCALGYGDDDRLSEAWSILNNKTDAEGKYVLNGTLTKPYLPKERVGKPSKWVTFYALLAQKEKNLLRTV